MASIDLNEGHRFTFRRIGATTIITDSTDHVHTPTIFRNQVVISGSTMSGHGTAEPAVDIIVANEEPALRLSTGLYGTIQPLLELKHTSTEANDHAYMRFNHTSNNFSMGVVHGSAAGNDEKGFFIFSDDTDVQTDGDRIMFFDTTKNVYIPNGGVVIGGANNGTEAEPADGTLRVNEYIELPLDIKATDATATFNFQESSTSGYTTTFNMDNTGLTIGHNTSVRNFEFQTNSTTRMTLAGDQTRVGIGITSGMDKRLHIHDSGIKIDGASALDTEAARFVIDTDNSTAHRCMELRSDNGIALVVDADGTIEMPNLDTYSSGGNNVKWHSGVIKRNSSTRKVKKNIKDLDSSFVDNFSKLRPAQWLCRMSDQPGFGFIADEISEVNKSYATYGPDWTRDEKGQQIRIGKREFKKDSDKQVPNGLDETAILTAAVAKIQQLEKRIEELENR